MRGFILLVVIVVAVFGYPLFNEDARSECDALERIAIRITLPGDDDKDKIVAPLVQGFSKGDFASAVVKNEYPRLPATAACTMLYWRALVDPKSVREDMTKLRSS